MNGMEFKEAITTLDTVLSKKDPATFNSSWILRNVPATYRYIWKNIRTENNEINWDIVTRSLDKRFWRRWQHPRTKPEPYWNKKEVHRELRRYKDKLYTFITAINDEDKYIRDMICVALVRLTQNGNKSAQKELTKLLHHTIDNWIEYCWKLKRWRGYEYRIKEKIEGCIRGYKHTGSFMAYLFKTLEYSGQGLRPLHVYSLNENIAGMNNKTRMDLVTQDPETGEAKMYDKTTAQW
mgnify:CR=1 FL=1